MIRELLYKWFGLELPPPCATCEVLRIQLEDSNRERKRLLEIILEKDKPQPAPVVQQEFEPILPNYRPWKVQRQMLEAEDRKRAQILREKQDEMEQLKIKNLEKELNIPIEESKGA